MKKRQFPNNLMDKWLSFPLKRCGFESSSISFFLSFVTGSLIHEHYTRECEFGNFDKIKNKNNTKKPNNTKKTQKLLAEFLFKCPKLLCGLGICHRRRQTIPMWTSSGGGGGRNSSGHHCMSGVCGIEHYVMTW